MQFDGDSDAVNPLDQPAVRHLVPTQAPQTEEEKESGDVNRRNELLIPFIAPLSSQDSHTASLFLSPSPTSLLNKPNVVQLRWRARLPAQTAQSVSSNSRRPTSHRRQSLSFPALLRRLPVFEPLSYRVQTAATLVLSDDEYLTFTPSVTYTSHASASSMLLAYHTQLSPSLLSSVAVDLASPASLTASTSILLPSSAVTLAIRGESDGVSVKGGWRQQLGADGGLAAVELATVGAKEQSAWVGYVKEQSDGRGGQRVGVMLRSNGSIELSGRIVRPLQWCPPFNRCYMQATSLHHICPPTQPPALPPQSSSSHLALTPIVINDPYIEPLLSPQALSILTPAHLSLEMGVGAHLNPQHSIDVGLGWSTLGCYFNVAMSSAQSTFSFPVYFTAPASVSTSSLPSLFSLAVGTPIAFCLVYSLLVSPLYRYYTRRREALKAVENADIVAYTHLRGVIERVAMQQPAQYSQPQLTDASPSSASSVPAALTIVSAVYGWRRGHGGEVHGLDVSGVLRFWVRGGRLRLSDCRKRRMLGFGGVERQEWMVGDEWRLGVLIVYTSGGALREVWVGEREAADLPSQHHRGVRVG